MADEIILKVDGMGCQACVAAVEKAVRNVAPAAKVAVTLAEGRVAIEGSGLTRVALVAAVSGAGYDVIEGG